MNKKLEYQNGKNWAEVTIEFEDGKLSICGSMGEIVSLQDAKKQALEYWTSYFDEMPAEIIEMNKRCGSKCHNSLQAAKYVLSVDGQFHGLDLHKVENGKAWLLQTCGQCVDSIAEELPEFPKIKRIAEIAKEWHLNDMHSGTEAQEKAVKEFKELNKDVKREIKFEDICNMLKNKNLLFDKSVKGKNRLGYKYGSAWLKREVPERIIRELFLKEVLTGKF